MSKEKYTFLKKNAFFLKIPLSKDIFSHQKLGLKHVRIHENYGEK